MMNRADVPAIAEALKVLLAAKQVTQAQMVKLRDAEGRAVFSTETARKLLHGATGSLTIRSADEALRMLGLELWYRPISEAESSEPTTAPPPAAAPRKSSASVGSPAWRLDTYGFPEAEAKSILAELSAVPARTLSEAIDGLANSPAMRDIRDAHGKTLAGVRAVLSRVSE